MRIKSVNLASFSEWETYLGVVDQSFFFGGEFSYMEGKQASASGYRPGVLFGSKVTFYRPGVRRKN